MVGGMENMSFAFATEFSKIVNTTIISWGKSQKYLPLFLPGFFILASYYIITKKITHVHLGDALLSPLGLLLKSVFNVQTSTTVCGLDITYDFLPYQLIIPKCVARLDKVICISNATLDETLKRGIPKDKCTVIPCGIYPNKLQIEAGRIDLEKLIHQQVRHKKVLVTVGRLVKRKGVHWFINTVFPQLGKDYVYLVIGAGPEKDKIQKLIEKKGLHENVVMLGKISDRDLKIIYNTADLFVMPNIKVKGDMEGFGIVATEATSTGLPVIASKLEGIADAIIPTKTGVLVEPYKASEFRNAIIHAPKFSRNEVKKITDKMFSWKHIARLYISAI